MVVFEFDIEVYGKMHHIEVSRPAGGGGGSYHVNIDRYHRGQIVSRPWGLHPYVEPGRVLTGDDIGVIIDMLTEVEANEL